MSLRLLGFALIVLVALAPGAGADEPFPTRAVTVVNPFPPGGLIDLTVRPLVAAMERLARQPVLLVNKPGAAGAVGMQSVAVAKPDGYTVLATVPAFTSLPEVDLLFGRTPTFTREQFVPIARLNADPTIIVVNAEQPWKSVKELLDDARRRPGEITFSSSGIYGASHVPMEMLLQAAGGLKMRHLPTTGGGPATTAVLGNHAHLWASTTGPATPHVKSGKFRALAVTGATRHPHFPDVPTLREQGYDVEYYLWIALFAPKQTPPHALKALRDLVRRAVKEPDVIAAAEKVGTPIAYLDADEFGAWFDKDARVITATIRKRGKVEAKQ
jgi:tripartite-type tricarboxylate transporter receptor subunit TctC